MIRSETLLVYSVRRGRRDKDVVVGRGMTLVELLIVVSVVTLLIAASVPLLRTTIRENRIREASRMLNTMVAAAKARAAETGRAVALELVRNAPGSNAVTEVFLAETPNPFMGDLFGARCLVRFDPTANQLRWEISFNFDANSPSLTADGTTALIKRGDEFRIQFGNRGAFYNAYRDLANGDYVIRIPDSLQRLGTPPDTWIPPAGFWLPGNPATAPGNVGPPSNDGEWGRAGIDDDGNGIVNDLREAGWPNSDDFPVGLPFQIYLAPRRVSSSVMQLPEGAAIDLGYSGMGVDMLLDRSLAATQVQEFSGVDFDVANVSLPFTPLTNTTPVRIAFSPGGEVEFVSFGGVTFPPAGSIHLLVGLIEQMVPQDNTSITPNPIPWSAQENTSVIYSKNISDPTAIWVSIGFRTGSLTTSENAWLPSGGPDFVSSLLVAREFAQKVQTMGGR